MLSEVGKSVLADKEVKFDTQRSIIAMLDYAIHHQGRIVRSELHELFNRIGINHRARVRALNILYVAFSTEEPGVYYIPVTAGHNNMQSLRRLHL